MAGSSEVFGRRLHFIRLGRSADGALQGRIRIVARMRERTPCRGLTLLELAVALALAAALIVLGGPMYQAWIADIELRNRVDALVNAMAFARGEALKRNGRVNLCHSPDGAQCADAGGWEGGWLVYADDNGNGELDGDEPVIRVEAAAERGITVRGNRPVADYVSYTEHGHTRMANGALQMGTFTVCRPGRDAIEVVLANGGRVRVSRTGRACP
jgi:type IV fimbrial biogenesis protein FimT